MDRWRFSLLFFLLLFFIMRFCVCVCVGVKFRPGDNLIQTSILYPFQRRAGLNKPFITKSQFWILSRTEAGLRPALHRMDMNKKILFYCNFISKGYTYIYMSNLILHEICDLLSKHPSNHPATFVLDL